MLSGVQAPAAKAVTVQWRTSSSCRAIHASCRSSAAIFGSDSTAGTCRLTQRAENLRATFEEQMSAENP